MDRRAGRGPTSTCSRSVDCLLARRSDPSPARPATSPGVRPPAISPARQAPSRREALAQQSRRVAARRSMVLEPGPLASHSPRFAPPIGRLPPDAAARLHLLNIWFHSVVMETLKARLSASRVLLDRRRPRSMRQHIRWAKAAVIIGSSSSAGSRLRRLYEQTFSSHGSPVADSEALPSRIVYRALDFKAPCRSRSRRGDTISRARVRPFAGDKGVCDPSSTAS